MKNVQRIQTLVDFVATAANKVLQATGGTDMIDSSNGSNIFGVEDVYEIAGIVNSDTAATLTLTWGFAHNNANFNQVNGNQYFPAPDAPVFTNSQTFAIVGGTPYNLTPVPVLATHVKINVKTTGADTANFRMYLRKVLVR
jgi:hypothetical protein